MLLNLLTVLRAMCRPGHILYHYLLVAVQRKSVVSYLLPKPKAALTGSRGILPFSLGKNLSGLNSEGSGYSSESLKTPLDNLVSELLSFKYIISTDQILGTTIVPLGMRYPLYSSSSFISRGEPKGVTG